MDEEEMLAYLEHYGVLGMRWGKSGKRGRSKLGFTPKSNAKPSKITNPLLQKIADQKYDRQKAGKFFSHSVFENMNKVYYNQPKKLRTNMQVILNSSVFDVQRALIAREQERAGS